MNNTFWWTAATIFVTTFTVVAAGTYLDWPMVRPQGQHRAPRTTPAPAAEYVPLAALIASGDAEPNGFEWCSECTGRRPHTFHADSSRTCLHCGHDAKAGEL